MEARYSVEQLDAMITECDTWITLVEKANPGDASAQIVLERYSRALIAFKVMLEDAKDRPYTEAGIDAIRVALGLELLDRSLDEQATEAKRRETSAFPCNECLTAGAILKGHTHKLWKGERPNPE
jgi:hypothetical protein